MITTGLFSHIVCEMFERKVTWRNATAGKRREGRWEAAHQWVIMSKWKWSMACSLNDFLRFLVLSGSSFPLKQLDAKTLDMMK